MGTLIGIGLALVTVIAIGLLCVGVYNTLTRLREQYRNAFSQIDVQLKRRHDLIPNLVETARAYMSHERETLERVIAARNAAEGALRRAEQSPGDPSAMRDLSSAEAELGGAMGRLLVTVEAYPDLKANQNMMQLTEELTSTENRIGFARQAYNDGVTRFNVSRKTFPNVLVAGVFGFGEDAELLEYEESREELNRAPEVSF